MTDNFQTVEGDLLSASRGFIIHGCNDKGIMGSGVAAGVKARHPDAFLMYRSAFETGKLKLGTCTFYQVHADLWIVNAVTQTLGTADPLSLPALEQCFERTLNFMMAYEVARGTSVTAPLPLLFPMIGAGRAGGDWNVISKLINRRLAAAAADYSVARPATLFTVKVEPTDCR